MKEEPPEVEFIELSEEEKKEKGSKDTPIILSSEYLKDPELILHIHKELDKEHLDDHKVKLTAFIGACTAYLDPHTLHKSQAIKGSSSVGKDNLIRTVLTKFPKNDWILLTHATQSCMQDDIGQYKIIAYSEMNANRENGANSHLIETLKQMTEGGTSSMKKDMGVNFKVAKHTQQTQKTVFYGTTEIQEDDELSTRFVVLSITGSATKTRTVNENTLDWFGGGVKNDLESWLPDAISCLPYNKVVIPYAKYLKEKVNGKEIFDSSSPRGMRDVKRIMAYTCAIAWLHQLQRKVENNIIISEPYDFLLAVLISGNFFNQTYKGLGDQRLQNVLDIMKDYEKENLPATNIDVPRDEIQRRMGVSKNTIKGYLKEVSNMSMVVWTRNESNHVYYKRCQKGIKKGLIGVNLQELKQHLEVKKGVNLQKTYSNTLKKLQNILETPKNQACAGKIDTLELTPLDQDVINFNCTICGETPCHAWDSKSRPVCKGCYEALKANTK